MSEQDDRPLDPWVRAALLAEGLDGGPTDAQRARMATTLAAALGLSAAALLGHGDGGGGDGDGDGDGDGGGGDGDGGGGGGDGGDGGSGGSGGDGGSGGGAGDAGGGGAGIAAAGAGAAAGVAGSTIASKTAALVLGALIAGGGIGATISELRPRSAPPAQERVARDTRTPATGLDAPGDAADAATDAATDAANDAATDAANGATDAAADAPSDPRGDDVASPADAGPAVRRDASMPRADAGRAGSMTADELARERELIEVARSALRSGDLQLAGRSLIEHGMRFPDGALVEEQRVLSIELLAAKGDLGGAKAKASAFRREFPRSVFRARVDAIAPP